MNENRSPIPSRLYNAAKGGHVAGTADIIDDNKDKTQDVINKEIDSALENRYTKNETYSKTELNNLITTPEQKYVTLTAKSGDTLKDIFDGITGAANTVYRVGSWDGNQYNTTKYAEYGWTGTNFVPLDVKEYGIDDEPTAGSDNLVKSGGVADKLAELGEKEPDSTKYTCYIKDGVWKESQWALSSFYKVYKNTEIIITSQDDMPAFYALLKDTSHVDGTIPNYIEGQSLQRIEKQNNAVISVTEDCYLYITDKTSSTYNYTPKSVIGNIYRIINIENTLNETSEKVNDLTKFINAIDIIAKDKTIDLIWEPYGVTIDGTIGTSTTYSHANVSVNQGDIIKIDCTNFLPAFYVPVSVLSGSVYIPKRIYSEDWKTFIYIADKAEIITLTARERISVKTCNSEALGDLSEQFVNLSNIIKDYDIEGLKDSVERELASDIDAVEYNGFYDGNAGNIWKNTSSVKSYFGKLKKGDVVNIKAPTSNPSFFCLVSSIKTNAGDTPSFIQFNNIQRIEKDKVFQFITTVDCYLYYMGVSYSTTYAPEYIRILGKRLYGIESQLNDYNIPIESYNAVDKAKQIYPIWESGKITTTGEDAEDAYKLRTKGFIYIGNYILTRIKTTNKNYLIHLYNENKEYIRTIYHTVDTNDEYIVLNTYAYAKNANKAKYMRVVLYDTDSANITISVDTLLSLYKSRKSLNNPLVKCAAHQGINMHVPDDKDRVNGGNMLSAFWGAYLSGFDVNLVNHLFTADGVPVCSHDNEFTDDNGNNVVISSLTLEQLNTHTIKGENIPTLDSVVYLSKTLGLEVFLVNVDILSGQDNRLQTIFSILNKYRMWNYTWLMCSHNGGDALAKVLAYNKKAKVVLCQTPISSTDYSSIEPLIQFALDTKTDYNDVMLWVSGQHSVENLQRLSESLSPTIKIGAYNVDGNLSEQQIIDTACAEKLPYLDLYSSHSSSYGSAIRNIELSVESKFPTITKWGNGEII